MSELSGQNLTAAEYQSFVSGSRFKVAESGGWQEAYSTLISEEVSELLFQHGTGSLLLLPKEFGHLPSEDTAPLRADMVDEMGDLLWYTTDAADRLGTTLPQACTTSLRSRKIYEAEPLSSFADIEKAAVTHAAELRVLNKLGMISIDAPAYARSTSLLDNPHYVFMRTANRLTRALDGGKQGPLPTTATELERVQGRVESIGGFVLSMAYVAKERLGIPFEEVARFNIAKLSHRELHGKDHDIHFDVASLGEA